MASHLSTAIFILMLCTIQSNAAGAHDVPWRAGESRVIGVGHCAKGACMKRVYWGRSKPHHHVTDTTVHFGHFRCHRV